MEKYENESQMSARRRSVCVGSLSFGLEGGEHNTDTPTSYISLIRDQSPSKE